jgi:hypothetical protein
MGLVDKVQHVGKFWLSEYQLTGFGEAFISIKAPVPKSTSLAFFITVIAED